MTRTAEERGELALMVTARQSGLNLPRSFARLFARTVLEAQSARPQRVAREYGQLTPRRLEVVRLVAAGYSAKEIGSKLFLSEATVKQHIESARRDLKARDRAHLAAIAVLLGLVDPADVLPAEAPADR